MIASSHVFFSNTFSASPTPFLVFSPRGNASEVKAKFIVEAANHPTDPEADEVNLCWKYVQICEC